MNYDSVFLAAAARQRAAASTSTSTSVPSTSNFEWPRFEDEDFEDGDEAEGGARYEKEVPPAPSMRSEEDVGDENNEEEAAPSPPPPPPIPTDASLASELNSSSASFLLNNIILQIPLLAFYLFLIYLAVMFLSFALPYFFSSLRWTLMKLGWLIIKSVNGTELVLKGAIWLSRWIIMIAAIGGIVGGAGTMGLYCYWAPTNPLRKLSYDRLALLPSVPVSLFLRSYYALPISKYILLPILIATFIHLLSPFTPFSTRDLLTLPYWLIRNWKGVKEHMGKGVDEGNASEKLDEQWEELMQEKEGRGTRESVASEGGASGGSAGKKGKTTKKTG